MVQIERKIRKKMKKYRVEMTRMIMRHELEFSNSRNFFWESVQKERNVD